MYFARLDVLAESDSLDSRVRFLCRDVIELRRANWVPRVKKLEAMTLNEIHAEAAAALGISPRRRRRSERGPGDGWEVVGAGGKSSSNNLVGMGGGSKSSLSGPYVAPRTRRRCPREKEKASETPQHSTRRASGAAAALFGPAAPQARPTVPTVPTRSGGSWTPRR